MRGSGNDNASVDRQVLPSKVKGIMLSLLCIRIKWSPRTDIRGAITDDERSGQCVWGGGVADELVVGDEGVDSGFMNGPGVVRGLIGVDNGVGRGCEEILEGSSSSGSEIEDSGEEMSSIGGATSPGIEELEALVSLHECLVSSKQESRGQLCDSPKSSRVVFREGVEVGKDGVVQGLIIEGGG